ncbi:MAG: VWA domain-containing protein [Acidobacteria bacterium]|nr:VWA domain-containing protein [Acidobacteriota bacterium]
MMRRPRPRSRQPGHFVFALVTFAAIAPALAQQETVAPQFGAAVDIARIEVAVEDDDGNFADGLSTDDFRLLVNGVPRDLVAAYSVDARADAAPAMSSANTPVSGMGVADLESTRPPVARRHFLVYLDLTRMSRSDLRNARNSAIRFLEERVAPADMVGLATYSPRRGLSYHVPFTADHSLSLQALGAITTARASERIADLNQDIPLDELVDLLDNDVTDAEEFLREMEQTRVEMQSENSLDSLREIAGTLGAIEGRKHLLYFSRGYSDRLVEDHGGRQTLMESTRTAALAGVAIHTFQPSNLPVSNVHDVREMTPTFRPESRARATTFVSRQALLWLSAETGGTSWFFRHAVNNGLEEVEERTRKYYVLGFPILPGDPDEATLEVSSRRATVAVAWAPTFIKFPSRAAGWTAAQRQYRVAEALQIGTEINDVEMNLLAAAVDAPEGQRRLGVVASVSGKHMRKLVEARGDGGLDLDILGFALTPWSTVSDYFRTRLVVDPGALDAADFDEPLRYYNQLQVPAGRYFVKVLIREAHTGLMTSRTVTFDTPSRDAGDLRLSRALFVVPPSRAPLTRALQLTEPPPHRAAHDLTYPFVVAGRELVPVNPEVVRPGENGWLYLRAEDLGTDPATGTPQVSSSILLLTPEGTPRNLAQGEVVATELEASGRSMRFLFHYQLPADLSSGEYTLAIDVRDHVARNRRQVQTLVTVIEE